MSARRFGGGGGGGYGGYGGSPPQVRLGPPMTPIVRAFMIACGAVYVLQSVFPVLTHYFALVPGLFFRGWIWQLATFNFLHGPLMHLVMNLFMIWMFGGELEMKLGQRRFILLMVVSGMGAGLSEAAAIMLTDPVSAGSHIIGASGIVFGLLLVYGMTWPNRQVLVMFIIPMRVKWMVFLFGLIEFMAVMSARSPGAERPGVAHLAHLGGMLFAYLFMRYDVLYMKARRTYYDRKLAGYRKKFRVHQGGREENDDEPPTYH
ncbi:rhomboid family intramembrane serine protease [bacterium]|nr:rhomboid family intramembrane serine protease [bacterium]